MNIEEHWDEFFKFEVQNSLFDEKTEDNLYLWDIIRFHIYIKFLWGDEHKKNNSKKEAWNIRIRRLVLKGYSFLHLLASLFKSKEYFFFIYSRDKSEIVHINYDKNADDVLKHLHRKALIIETFYKHGIKFKYRNSYYNPVSILLLFFRRFKRYEDYNRITSLIKAELGIIVNNDDINSWVNDFRLERKIYTLLFQLKKTKKIFITQNGIQKGLFAAALDLEIPVYEFQHGVIDLGHLAYNYPDIITTRKNLYLPDYLFLFSDFWKKGINFPVKKMIALGNSGFATQQNNQDTIALKQGMTVISADVFGKKLIDITIQFASCNPETAVYFKLHPNQFGQSEVFYNVFKAYKNISVITDKYSISELIGISKAFLLIQSTAAYEALQAKTAVFIIMQSSYYRHRHIFDLPGVYLIKDINGLASGWAECNNTCSDVRFFQDFDQSLFRQLIK